MKFRKTDFQKRWVLVERERDEKRARAPHLYFDSRMTYAGTDKPDFRKLYRFSGWRDIWTDSPIACYVEVRPYFIRERCYNRLRGAIRWMFGANIEVFIQ